MGHTIGQMMTSPKQIMGLLMGFIAYGRIYHPFLCFSKLFEERSEVVCDGMWVETLKPSLLTFCWPSSFSKHCMSTAHDPHPHPKHPPDAESKPFVDLGCCPRMPHALVVLSEVDSGRLSLRNRPFDFCQSAGFTPRCSLVISWGIPKFGV